MVNTRRNPRLRLALLGWPGATVLRAFGATPPCYGAKYPRIVLAVSFGEAITTRTGRHWFGFQ